MACAELELELFGQGDGQYLLRFRFLLPGASAEIDLGLNAPVRAALDFAGLLSLQANPQAYGARLTEMLFSDPRAAAAFGQARVLAEAAGAPLRLRLYFGIDPGRLHDLLWETLLDPNRKTPLGTDENVLLSRWITSAKVSRDLPREIDRLRMLAVIASPRNVDPQRYATIDVPVELERVRRCLPDVEITALAGCGQATYASLLSELNSRRAGRSCDVLYLVAHGLYDREGPAILLEQPDGDGHKIAVERLAADLAGLRELPLMAVLVSCGSAGDASLGNALLALGPRLASTGIPVVLAMHGGITFPTMERFLSTFFAELQQDGEIDRALAVARRQVSNRPDWWMPVLFSRLRGGQILRPPALARPFQRLPFEPETVYIPPGPFQMGRDPGPGVPPWETPRHTIDLGGFRIGRYPVTNREFSRFVRQTGELVDPASRWYGQVPPPDQLDHPVIGVSWYQAMGYCRWLSKMTGRSYTLPTEAQWERAARGRQGWLYPWGNEWQAGRCNPDPNQVTPVNCFPAQNASGVCDMIGNVREWTLSLWGCQAAEPDEDYCYPYQEEICSDPNASLLVRRIYRGGAASTPAAMTCTTRGGFLPDRPGPTSSRHGFRVVINGSSRSEQGE